ncbi:hypothetical protein COV18_05290 [Candidatus Woesearchaeota archaeon CG10_big_fil_rev_8_21_14_0_10_37_12]|nr:MAG: hypothetical protein COV18_05290 [Candidatus Woesearchaeota archaeon CG10_big_fil_rev_8_21_14_0_10_37_12]
MDLEELVKFEKKLIRMERERPRFLEQFYDARRFEITADNTTYSAVRKLSELLRSYGLTAQDKELRLGYLADLMMLAVTENDLDKFDKYIYFSRELVNDMELAIVKIDRINESYRPKLISLQVDKLLKSAYAEGEKNPISRDIERYIHDANVFAKMIDLEITHRVAELRATYPSAPKHEAIMPSPLGRN